MLSINGGKVTYDKRDLPAGIFPYNIAVTPDGKLALTADNGSGGSSDGSVDTVSVIDLEADPPRVIDHVTVGDSPEGLAISPKGDLAITVEARGSNMKGASFYHPAGAVTALRIDGKKVTNAGEINVGAFPEGGAFSADGQYLYVRWTDVMPNLSFVQQTWWAIDDSGRTQFDCSTPDCMDPSCTGQDGCSGYSGPATSSGSTHPPTPLPTSPAVSARSDRFVSRRSTVATIRR